MHLSPKTKRLFLTCQQEEMTDHAVYTKIAKREKNPANKKILTEIAKDEMKHAQVWKSYTGQDIGPNRLKVFFYSILSIIMGYTFIIKFMERGEYFGGKLYEQIEENVPELPGIIRDEQAHEDKLMAMLDEERLNYVGDMVLGLNDALVELTGTIAGLTFALGNTRLVALSGIITGISATLSMAASNYLAQKAGGSENALKSSIYTGVAYLITVIFLVLPYLIFPNDAAIYALITMLIIVVLIILFFTFYTSVAKSEPFRPQFLRMVTISLGVAVISFLIGLLAKEILGVDL